MTAVKNLLRFKGRLLSDATWVITGQVGTALGTVLGVRLLTQLVPPTTFGVVSLALGAAALATNVACTPLTQAALHFHPSFAARGMTGELHRSLSRCLERVAFAGAVLTVVAALAYSLLAHGSPVVIALLALLLACDCWRSVGTTLMNAAREHRRYALWQSGDAWARPVLAGAAVWVFGPSPAAVLGGYLAASALMIWFFRKRTVSAFSAGRPVPATDQGARLSQEPSPGPAEAPQPVPPGSSPAADLDTRMWRYALPLAPLGLIGWANGLGDRYIIGGLLSVADAGIYAAAYGLASRPLLMVSGAIELAVRPVYQQAVSLGERERANRLLLLWFTAISLAGTLGVAAIALWRNEIAAVLLGPQYRHGAILMPWIASGYMLLTISYVFERVCYAHARTHRVLIIQSCAAAAAAVATTLGILAWGLIGAAAAVPVYFSVQLAVAALLARRTHRQEGQVMQPLEIAG